MVDVITMGGHIAPPSERRALALFIVLAAQGMFAMDLLIVVPALQCIPQDLGFQPTGQTRTRPLLAAGVTSYVLQA